MEALKVMNMDMIIYIHMHVYMNNKNWYIKQCVYIYVGMYLYVHL